MKEMLMKEQTPYNYNKLCNIPLTFKKILHTLRYKFNKIIQPSSYQLFEHHNNHNDLKYIDELGLETFSQL